MFRRIRTTRRDEVPVGHSAWRDSPHDEPYRKVLREAREYAHGARTRVVLCSTFKLVLNGKGKMQRQEVATYFAESDGQYRVWRANRRDPVRLNLEQLVWELVHVHRVPLEQINTGTPNTSWTH